MTEPDQEVEATPIRGETDVSAMLRQVWNGVLGNLTQEGATRADLLEVTYQTAHAIVEATVSALWPDGATTAQEATLEASARMMLEMLTAAAVEAGEVE